MDVQPDELTDEEIVARLREAGRDEQEGRLVRCDSAGELWAFFASLGTCARERRRAHRCQPAEGR